MTRLKPCPFCGGEANITNNAKRKNVYGDIVIGTAIYCSKCEVIMFYTNRSIAIEAWNKRAKMNRNLDGIYLRIKRDNKWQSVCLSDMTVEELEENLNPERGEWLKGAVIHLAQTIHNIGEQFGLERVEE